MIILIRRFLFILISALGWFSVDGAAAETNLNYQVLVPKSAYDGKNWVPDIVRLKDGRIFLAFVDGYFHGLAFPTPARDHLTRLYYESMGMATTTNVNRPKGSRIMGMWSSDEGKTWTKPVEVIDNPTGETDLALTVMPDGTVVMSTVCWVTGEDIGWSIHPRPFVNPVTKGHSQWSQAFVQVSEDGGKTWSPPVLIPEFLDEVQGFPSPVVETASGDWVVTYWGNSRMSDCAAVVASTDRGKTWKLRSIIDGVTPLDEAALTRLKDDRLIACYRPASYRVFESSDDGRTWRFFSAAKNSGKMEWPSLYQMSDGKVILFWGRISLTWTKDFKTWFGPFVVEKGGDGKFRGVELKDGSLLCVWHCEFSRRNAEIRIAKVKLSETGLEVTLP